MPTNLLYEEVIFKNIKMEKYNYKKGLIYLQNIKHTTFNQKDIDILCLPHDSCNKQLNEGTIKLTFDEEITKLEYYKNDIKKYFNENLKQFINNDKLELTDNTIFFFKNNKFIYDINKFEI